MRNRSWFIPPLDHSALDKLFLLDGSGQGRGIFEKLGRRVRGTHFAPWAVGFDLEVGERNGADDVDVFFRWGDTC